ncbi:MAG: Holliday junction branch migration protein RuvA [Salinibacterium sp.]|nr:Holliday junction branch migration protein RuvA [Salinibacterium sp.]
MISSLRGTVLAASGGTAVIEVGGVGFAVNVTPNHARILRVGSIATLRTALIVREDDLSLYGFADDDELVIFDLLRGVSGVGPKSALGVLGELSPNDVAVAVNAEDDAAFRRVSGIGPKTAKLIVVSLAGKVPLTGESRSARSPAGGSVSENVVIALVGLGWPERVAAQAVDEVLATALAAASKTDIAAESQTVSTLLRLSLAYLGPQQSSGVLR